MHDVIIIGGGASGLMCASTAGARGLDVLVLEKGPKVGLKILVSGGGRCNFTNRVVEPGQHYLSQIPQFCISAMRRFEPEDFIGLVEAAGIEYHERKHGQLFCNGSAKQIVTMLLDQCALVNVSIRTKSQVNEVFKLDDGSFSVSTGTTTYTAKQVVLACGGLSLPKIASDFAYRLANNLGIEVQTPRAALVPFTWTEMDKERYVGLSGIAVEAEVSCSGASFRENVLFTHRGLSGPAILQISSYWQLGEQVCIDWLPDLDLGAWLCKQRHNRSAQQVSTLLKEQLPNRLVDALVGAEVGDAKLGSQSTHQLLAIGQQVNTWTFVPNGTEGYRTAEVTLGGIDTNEVSSKTFELKSVPGLFAIGEALDVTGWLGGYNFQWAWASGWCCGVELPLDGD